MQDRTLLRVSGVDARPFLQGLVTNDVNKIDVQPIYTALLTPQGKYIADFFLAKEDDAVLIDVAASHAQALATKLSLYKLRAEVEITPDIRKVHIGVTDMPAHGFVDPRHAELGWRAYGGVVGEQSMDWDKLRVTYCIPETGIELTADSYILEAGFERLNGVDYRKGCFVGQEIVARMHHKTELRKGLVVVDIDGTAPPAGTDITTEDGKPVGALFTSAGERAIAYLRLDRATGEMRAGNARLAWDGRKWFA